MSCSDKSPDLIPKVLLVDDELAFGRAVQRHLEKHGYFCEHVCSLEGARESLTTDSPSLLILDMKLPDGNGLQFLKEIEEKRDFPVFVLNDVEAVHMGQFSHKPVVPAQLQFCRGVLSYVLHGTGPFCCCRYTDLCVQRRLL